VKLGVICFADSDGLQLCERKKITILQERGLLCLHSSERNTLKCKCRSTKMSCNFTAFFLTCRFCQWKREFYSQYEDNRLSIFFPLFLTEKKLSYYNNVLGSRFEIKVWINFQYFPSIAVPKPHSCVEGFKPLASLRVNFKSFPMCTLKANIHPAYLCQVVQVVCFVSGEVNLHHCELTILGL